MRISVKAIEANPFRNMTKYPIDSVKLETLKNSITETFFWDNLLARKHPDKEGRYQIAYGHHRLVALKDLKVDEIDIPVKKLDDPTMLKIMGDENADEYRMNPEVLSETILVVKRYLDSEIKEKTWETLQRSEEDLFDSKRAFQTAQGMGVGEDTIRKFLGKNWSLKKIRSALADLRARGDLESPKGEEPRQMVDKEASRDIDSSVEARTAFRKSVQDYNVPVEKQREIARALKGKKASAREITRAVKREAQKIKPGKNKDDPKLKRLSSHLEGIQDKSHSLAMTIRKFIVEAEDIEVEEIGGLKAFFVQNEVEELLRQIQVLIKFFGYTTTSILNE